MTYFLDAKLTVAESTRPTEPGGGVGYYRVAIRQLARPGWTFRFHTYGEAAQDTLAALNHPRLRVEAEVAA